MNRVAKAMKQIRIKDLFAPLFFILLLIPSLAFRVINKLRRRKLWLISEQGEARDNGFYFYEYMRKEHPEAFCYYAVDYRSAGFNKVKKLGNVIRYGSLKHWLYYMSANLNISSQKSGNPCPIFWYVIHVTVGLYKNRVFLQHGITHNDAKWIYYRNTKFKYFICGTKPEYDFVSKSFGYPKENVVLAGFARWDKLRDESRKQEHSSILIMPTWRNWLGGEMDQLFEKDDFMNTDYYKSWNGLINDDDFIEYIEQNGIVVYFYPHINMRRFISDFKTPSKNIKIISTECDIQDYFKKCSLMITDYSSVAFDFAFLKKPVIYYQFDKKEFRLKQHEEGYFKYERDGFGPVVDRLNDVVDCVKSSMDGGSDNRYERNIEKCYGGYESECFSEEIYLKLTGKSKKKKIIQVVNSMNIGGIETFILNLYRTIDRNKYEFVFLTNRAGKYDYQDEIESLGGRFVLIDSPRAGKRIKHLIQLNKVMKRERPDVVHCHTYYDSANVMIVAKHNGIERRITHSHTTQGFNLNRTFLHAVLAWLIRRDSTSLLACGNEAGMALYHKPGFKVVRNGIDLVEFEYRDDVRRKLRKSLGLDNEDIVIGHVGRLVDVKNHAFLLKVARNLIDRNNNYKVVLVGDGPLKSEIMKEIKKLDLDKHVIVLGDRSDVSELYNVFDLIVFPSIYEGFPVSLVEAQANGLSIISSSNIDKDSKINSNFKFLDLKEGVERWAEEILKISIQHVEPSKKIGQYSIEHVAKTMEQLYDGRSE